MNTPSKINLPKKMPPGANRTALMAAGAALHLGSYSAKLFEACSYQPRERKRKKQPLSGRASSSYLCLVMFASWRRAEYVGAGQFQVHQTSVWNAVVTPLRNGSFSYVAQISNSISTTKKINNFIRVHVLSIEP